MSNAATNRGGILLLAGLLGFWLVTRSVNRDSSGRTLVDRILGQSGGANQIALPSSSAGTTLAGNPITSAGNAIGNAIGGVVNAYSKLIPGRRDQGIDYSGTGPVGAVADGVVTHVGLWPGWPGTGGVVYRTAQGYVYVMEHFTPAAGLRVGSQVRKGQVIGTAPGGYPFIETGFANTSSSGPLTPYNGAADGTPMPGSFAFTRAFGLSGF